MGFEYPAGRAPGFDPSHPMAAGIRFSGVASGGSFLSLDQARSASTSGAPPAMQTVAGPGTFYSGAGSMTRFSGFPTDTPSAITMAAIITLPAAAARYVPIISNNYSGTPTGLQVDAGNLVLSVNGGSTSIGPSTSSIVNNVPFALAASYSPSAGKAYFRARNLATGAYYSWDLSNSTAINANSSTMTVGYASGGNNPNQITHAAMWSTSFRPGAVLDAFLADPWPFWLPEPAGAYAIRSAQWVLVNLHPPLASAVSAASSSRAAPSARIASAATMEAQARAAGAPYVKIAGHGRGASTASATGSPIVAVSAATRSSASSSGRAAPSVIVHLAAAARGMASASGRAAASVRVALASLSAASATGRASASVRVAAAARAMMAAAGRARPRFPPVIDPRAYLVAPRTIRALVARITTRTLRVKK